jgi:S2P endopeptidase
MSRYMSIVAFSLFIFNLLPIPYTDGSSLLRHLLSLYTKPRRSDPTSFIYSSSSTSSIRSAPNTPMKATLSSTSAALSSKPSINLSRQYELNSDDEDDYDAEQGDDRGDRKKEEGWKRRLRRGIEGGMMGVGAAWIAGWAMLSLLRSS